MAARVPRGKEGVRQAFASTLLVGDTGKTPVADATSVGVWFTGEPTTPLHGTDAGSVGHEMGSGDLAFRFLVEDCGVKRPSPL
jgi:hypothetical protein